MPNYTNEERRRIVFLNTIKQVPGMKQDAEEELQQIYHEAERREDLELKKAELLESKNGNKTAKAALIVSIVSAAITVTLSIIAICI